MNELFSYEFTVSQKHEGRYFWARVFLLAAYVLYVIIVLLIGAMTRIVAPMLAFIPLSVWMLVFITWRYVNVDYEYSIVSGVLTFTKIYGNRSRKKITEIRLKDASAIAPLGDRLQKSRLEAWGAERVWSAMSSSSAKDAYFIIYVNDKNEKCAFLFEATEKALKICKYYNQSTVVTNVSR
ncbi:MAG TPA: hypothetical protein GX011_06720 [Clostridiales bacterium]|nr:hypothetical protein [Clostridiales bacterium]